MIGNTVNDFIKKYKLSGTFLVAFSGGYDSMCLLNILCDLGYKPVAIHLNHNWRGEESRKEEENCKNFAKLKDIEFYSETLSDNIAKTETSAREARYEFFEKCAKKFNSNVIFTAHNFEDNAETVIYRIIKGTGTIGLQGIAEHRNIYYRPLLSVSRTDIENYCKEHNLNPNKDSSNENTKYKRNLIRKKIIPLMKEINPNVINAVNSLSEIAKEEFDNQKFKIRQLLIDNKIDYDRKKIEEINDFLNENKTSKSGKRMSLGENLWLFVNSKGFEIITKTQKSDNKIKIEKEGEYRFENYIFSVKPFDTQIKTFPNDKEFKAFISVDKIDFVLRHRQDGDFIKPLGTKGSQKIKKYLNEKKIPQHKKDELVFLCKDSEVIWAAGLGLSETVKVTNNPTHILELREVKNGKSESFIY